MSDIFGIENLIILAIAVAIFFRLRSVLGRRTGQERQPYDPYTAKPNGDAGARDNVVSLPTSNAPPADADTGPADIEARIKDHAEKETPLYDGLKAVIAADPSFDPRGFTEGASMAYEMIVTAFANGDRDTLQPLLAAEVYEGFEAAIAGREDSGQTMSTTLIGIEKIAITDANVKDDVARVTTRIDSEMITATYDKGGALISGDPNKVVDVVDVWTFERDTRSSDPNWALVATESA